MFEFCLCKSSNCPKNQECIRFLYDGKYSPNPVDSKFDNYLCTSKNNYNLKIHSTCDISVEKGGELLNGE